MVTISEGIGFGLALSRGEATHCHNPESSAPVVPE